MKWITDDEIDALFRDGLDRIPAAQKPDGKDVRDRAAVEAALAGRLNHEQR